MKRMTSRTMLAAGLALGLLLGGAVPAGASEGVQRSGDEPAPVLLGQTNDSGPEAKEKRFGPDQWLKDAAALTGLTPEEIRTGLASGKSLAELAASKGIKEADLVRKMTAGAEQKLDEAVKAGRLSQEKASEIKKRLPDKMTKLVQHKGMPEFHRKGHGDGHGMIGYRPDKSRIAGWLGMSEEELTKQLKSGKSLADIASGHGMSKEQLVAKLKDDMTPALEKYVTRIRKERVKDKQAGAKVGSE